MADVNATQFEPSTKLAPGELKGRVRRAIAVASLVSGSPGNGEQVNLMKLPKKAMIVDIAVGNTSGNGITAADLGDSNDIDGLMDGMDLDSSDANYLTAKGGNEGTNGYHVNTADIDKELWELLGYSTEGDAPQDIEIILTASTGAADATDTLVVEILYVVD